MTMMTISIIIMCHAFAHEMEQLLACSVCELFCCALIFRNGYFGSHLSLRLRYLPRLALHATLLTLD